jgi:hypothetical protein
MITLPDQQDWAQLSPAVRLDIARQIEKRLDGAARVIDPAEGGDARVIAFALGKRRFVFVPGGETRLGFDAASWQPTQEQQESFDENAEEYGIDETVQAYVASRTTLPRAFHAPPMLVAVEAEELGWTIADDADPRVAEARRKYRGQGGTVTIYDRGSELRISRGADGTQVFEIGERPVDRGAFENALRSDGLRLPSSDEWEWLCGAGATTLFRWGDDCPCDRYPTGKIAVHRAPNRNGLLIAFDPYRFEMVQEADVARGGDGGGSICGGEGFFLGWLPLATAYLDRAVCEPLKDGWPLGFAFARPVVDLRG